VRRIFVDASYFIAGLRRRDSLYELAIKLGNELSAPGNVRFVTTHLVIAEVLAYFSRAGEVARVTAVDEILRFLRRPDVQLVALTDDLLTRGLNFYRRRADQRYSLTDCVSMLVCRDLRIADVLTSDSDFEHEGFRILLKDG
jgi:predicted nucleic acid-binding protein